MRDDGRLKQLGANLEKLPKEIRPREAPPLDNQQPSKRLKSTRNASVPSTGEAQHGFLGLLSIAAVLTCLHCLF